MQITLHNVDRTVFNHPRKCAITPCSTVDFLNPDVQTVSASALKQWAFLDQASGVATHSLLPSQEMLYVRERLTLPDHSHSVSLHRPRMIEKEDST
jgi:hypothetical protein